MRRVVAFNLAKVEENDAKFFRGLRDAFTAYGADFKLFSPQSHNLLKDFRLPFDWVIRNIEKQHTLPPLNQVQRLPRKRREVWIRRVEQLSLQGDGNSPEELVAILERFSAFVLERFNPDVILGWNTLCPHSGILCEIAKAHGCKVYLLERGFLNNTWFLEKGGLVGHSEIVDCSFEELTGHDPEVFWEIGRSYLDTRPFDAMSRYVQHKNERFQKLLADKESSGRPLIGFFPPDDLSLGFAPAGTEDQRKHIPSHDSSLDAAIALAQAAPECDVVFKPHPSFRELDLPSHVGDNLFVIDHDYREVMTASDVVASTGSGLIVTAMAQGKAVLQLGRDQFSYKGITYDAQDEIRPALDAALQKTGLEERLLRFQTFIGYALSSYLVSSPSADVTFRRPVNSARDIMRECFGDLPPANSIVHSGPAHADDWVCRDRASLLEFLKGDRSDTYLVDFDHTLMFANSTELFLDHVRPKFVFIAVHWLLNWLVCWKSLAARGVQKHDIFDPLRILFCLIMAPWSVLTWRFKAPELASQFSNWVLLEHLQALPPEKVIIVSNGHPWLLKPLLRSMGLGQASLICGNILPGKSDIRRVGKLAACNSKIRNFAPNETTIITDSADDADLLSNAGNAFLIDWDDHKTKADPLKGYFPFVLTDHGKYPGANVVKRHRFQEDLPVILAAYCLASAPPVIEMAGMTSAAALALVSGVLLAALSCFLFFVSFNAVYELGYWENDFVAAQKEVAPNVSPQMQKFQDYPLRPAAWIWAACLGALGAVCAAASGIAQPLSGLLPVLRNSSGAFLLQVALLLAIWILALWGLRILFKAHNSVEETRRIYTFWGLHSYKLFCYALLFPISVVGVVLVVAQVFRHWPNYLIYRYKGDRSNSPKQEMRAFVFLALSVMMLFALPVSEVVTLTWLAGAWLFLRKEEYWLFLFKSPAEA